MTLVYFEGGQRSGQVENYDPAPDPDRPIVFDGPEWIGVYQRSDPLHVVRTKDGTAEVWHSLS